MTECSEIGDKMWDTLNDPLEFRSMQEAREFVRRFMPDEGPVIVDNVAERLVQRAEAHRSRPAAKTHGHAMAEVRHAN